ncbi:RNA polymerase sigma factor [Bacteroidota bacterium]
MSDNDIVNKITGGDKEAYRLIVEKYRQAIFRICMGYAHDENDANDLTQETFINAYQNLHKFKFKSAFSTWLYRIAVNLSLNFIRSKKRILLERYTNTSEASLRSLEISTNEVLNPEQIILNEEQSNIIKKELHKLSDQQKTAFILSKYDNMSQKEIAEIMKISEGAVESLIQRAKVNLYKNLATYFKKN